MSIVAERVKRLLDSHFVCYETIPHVTDYTALETAEHTHTPGRTFAKAVIVLVDQRMAMAVIPAPHHLHLGTLARHLHALHVKLAKEWRIKSHFPDCDRGAIPPFGNLYDMSTYICPDLTRNETITFNAGCHEMVISMSFADYGLLVNPTLVPNLSSSWHGG